MNNKSMANDNTATALVNKKKKCIILSHFYSVYVKSFLENMNKYHEVEFDILTRDIKYQSNIKKGIVNNFFFYRSTEQLIDTMKKLSKYDIGHIHYLTTLYGPASSYIKNICDKLIVSVWGSDYYGTTHNDRLIQEKILCIADNINFGNEVTLNDFNKYFKFKYQNKLSICRFGLTPLEFIKKIENVSKENLKGQLDIPKDSIVITCGHNAKPAQNHLQIIKSIMEVKDKLPDNCYYIFPMTYGDASLITQVRKQLQESGLKFKIFNKFLTDEENAKLRAVSDIMIQLQTTDQLSGSMQEYLYSNNIVVTGKWLPYEILKKNGAYFLEISEIKDIGKKLLYVIDNLQDIKNQCSLNKDVIWNMTSWEKAIYDWIDLYK